MGSFGWLCAKCKGPLLGFPYHGYSKFQYGWAVFKNGDAVSGGYDGYGRLGSVDLTEEMYISPFRIVHESCAGNQIPQYSDYPEDLDDRDDSQAAGYGEKRMEMLFGPPNLDELKEEATYACKICFMHWKAKWSGGVCPNGCQYPQDVAFMKDEDVAESIEGDYVRLAVCPNKECKGLTSRWARKVSNDGYAHKCSLCDSPLVYPTTIDCLAKTLD